MTATSVSVDQASIDAIVALVVELQTLGIDPLHLHITGYTPNESRPKIQLWFRFKGDLDRWAEHSGLTGKVRERVGSFGFDQRHFYVEHDNEDRLLLVQCASLQHHPDWSPRVVAPMCCSAPDARTRPAATGPAALALSPSTLNPPTSRETPLTPQEALANTTLSEQIWEAIQAGADAAIVADLLPQSLILPDWRSLSQHQRNVWMNSSTYLSAVGHLAFTAQVVAREHA